MTYPGEDAQWLNHVGDLDVLEWIELLATASTPQAYGARLAWFLWDLAGSTTCRQLTTGTYPGQARRPPTQQVACTCPYGRPPGTRGFGRQHLSFTINPRCVHHGSDVVRTAYRAGLVLYPWQVDLAELALAARRQGIPLTINHTRRSRRF